MAGKDYFDLRILDRLFIFLLSEMAIDIDFEK